jgi:hypothetical protein
MRKILILLALLGMGCITDADRKADMEQCRNRCVAVQAEFFAWSGTGACYCGGSLP